VVEHRLNSVAFPVLDTGQIAQLTGCTTVASKHCGNGEALIGVGDRSFRFFVVKSGEIEIIDYSGDEPRTIAIHRTGEFTGDISHLTGTPAIFSAIARGDSEVFEISGEALRHVLNQCPVLGDIILQAFIARRQLLRESPDFTGLRVIGSRYSPDTFRIRDFLKAEIASCSLGWTWNPTRKSTNCSSSSL
jgi:thioredoxin reductase (NADPH)